VNTATVKLIYGKIMTRAMELSHAQGAKFQMKGVQVAAAQEYYDRHPEDRFDMAFTSWWGAIMKGATSKAVEPASVQESHGTKKHKDTLEGRYLDVLMVEDVVPSDTFFNNLWGAKNGTLSSIRSRLKREGFAFQASHGGFIVTERPKERPECRKIAKNVASVEQYPLIEAPVSVPAQVPVEQPVVADEPAGASNQLEMIIGLLCAQNHLLADLLHAWQ
jgi:hypothetical protein